MSAQGLQQVQRQIQAQVLAPQLRQSLKILQVPALELRNVILEELQSNPTLEELPLEGVSVEAASSPEEPPAGEESDREEMVFRDDFSVLRQMDQDYRDSLAQEAAGHSYTSEDAERRQHFFDSLTSESSLQEHLLRQARLTDAPPHVLRALEYLVGSLEDSGLLPTPLPDLALAAGLPLPEVQAAAALLKSLDPVGIGAASLPECLLLQLQSAGRGQTLPARIVRDHFDLLLRRRLPEIARKEGVAIEAVQEALEAIAELDPAPGRRFGDDTNRSVAPDVTVWKEDGVWQVQLNSDYIPRLRLSHSYKELIARGNLSRTEREYLQDKFRSGKFLIGSIEQRQQTIERITRVLLRFQEGFFEGGVGRLKPLTMNQVAQEVGVHETTISRAIANKFIATPHGIFELKYFFTTGYVDDTGQTVSNTTVKDRIARLIEMENPAKPLSDQEIVRILDEENLRIARRTVAKYREELGIAPTHLRRRY